MFGRIAFKGILVAALIVVIGQAVQAAAADQWPPKISGLVSKLSSGENGCAIFLALKGGLKISCKDSAGDIKTYDCPVSGTKQVCTPGDKVIGRGDNYSSKCNQVCGPVSPSFK